MLFEKITHNRTADAVTEQIELLILQGILRPGDRLPGERELSGQVDVSRPILREALKALEERGLVASRPGEGTFVADLMGSVFSEPLVALIRRHPGAVGDYFEFRRMIEGWSAALAAERATEADREILRRLVADMAEAHAAAEREREAALDIEFHTAVGEAAHNVVLMHTLRSLYRLLADGVFYHRSRLYGRAAAREALMVQHRAIFEAILAGDGAAARAAAERHIDYVETTTREVERLGGREHLASLRLGLVDRRLGASRRPPAAATLNPELP
jgi:GntR family transcriptional repressor for pyruvate dehydrogenase complex